MKWFYLQNKDKKVDLSFDVDNGVKVKELLNENKIANEIVYVNAWINAGWKFDYMEKLDGWVKKRKNNTYGEYHTYNMTRRAKNFR